MKMIDQFLSPGVSHGRTGQRMTPKGVILHYVGNPGSSAEANRLWFENGAGGAHTSAHYIIGLDGEVLRIIPENERAQHAGKSYGTQWAAMAKMNNSQYIGIECCHPDSAGQFNTQTYTALMTLCVDICKRYNFEPSRDIMRHYDVSGKKCPLFYTNNPNAWTKLLEDISMKLAGEMVSMSVSLGEKPVLRLGDKGRSVSDMQVLINTALIGDAQKKLEVDGSFGPATMKALERFQELSGLNTSGICDAATWKTLFVYKAPAQSPEEITVANAIADGAISDPVYWTCVLIRSIVPDPIYVKALIDNYHALLAEASECVNA